MSRRPPQNPVGKKEVRFQNTFQSEQQDKPNVFRPNINVNTMNFSEDRNGNINSNQSSNQHQSRNLNQNQNQFKPQDKTNINTDPSMDDNVKFISDVGQFKKYLENDEIRKMYLYFNLY